MSVEQELLKVSNDLLQSISDRDWDKYSELCDEKMTAFEPEAGAVLYAAAVLACADSQATWTDKDCSR
jgi:hypothetical protein